MSSNYLSNHGELSTITWDQAKERKIETNTTEKIDVMFVNMFWEVFFGFWFENKKCL